MFPDGRTGKATKIMLLQHNLRLAAREMNIVPGLHSPLVSIPNWRMQDTPQYSTNMVRLFTMMRLQKSPPQAPPSLNPNAANTLECGGSTSTQQHRHQPQKPKQIHSKQSTSSSSSPAPAKHFSGTMHLRDSQLKRLSSMPYATETTQHGHN